MPVRDPAVIASAQQTPYAGYAVHRPRPTIAANPDRVVACVALLGIIVGSGIALGRAQNS